MIGLTPGFDLTPISDKRVCRGGGGGGGGGFGFLNSQYKNGQLLTKIRNHANINQIQLFLKYLL